MPRKNRKAKSLLTESPVEEPSTVEYVTEPVVAPVKPKRKYVRKKKKVEMVDTPEAVPVVAPVETVAAPVETVAKVKKTRKPRKPSAYNAYVATSMKSEDIKKLPPKQRFSAISKKWAVHKQSIKASA